MRRLFRWAFYALILVIVLAVAGILLLDTVARNVMESQIRTQTGMDVKVGKLSIGLLSPTISIEDFKLYNTAEFGGSPFVTMPELYVEYDRNSLRNQQLRLKLLRINISELSLIKNKQGVYNIAGLQAAGKRTQQPKPGQKVEFAGVDTLNVTLRNIRLGTVDSSAQDQQVDLKIEHQIFHDIKTEKDLQNMAFALIAKGGSSMLPLLTTPAANKATPVQSPQVAQ